MQNALISIITASLSSGTANPLIDQLGGWSDKHLPNLRAKAEALLADGPTILEVFDLAQGAVEAAQDLRGVVAGAQRALLAQAALVVVAREVLPEEVESWLVPLLSGEGLAALIESAFRQLFPGEVQPGSVQQLRLA